MFSNETRDKLKKLKEELNLSSSAVTEVYKLMKSAYREGFDCGCVRTSEEMVNIGDLPDMTIQQLANIVGRQD